MPPSPRHGLVTGCLALAFALAVSACDDGGGPDAGPAPDARADVALPDAALPDATIGTHADAAPDAALEADATPADAEPDAAPADADLDMAAPDMAAPDMAAPDMAEPDAEPDMAAPDAAPDMAEPDAGPPPLDPPRITELAARGALLDDDGEPSDWLELFNPNPAPYPLAGHHLTDDPDDPTRWVLPAVEIAARGYLVVFASGKDRDDPEAPLHTDFRLAAEGEYLALTDPDGAVLDAWLDWPPQIEAATYGRPMAVERSPLAAAARAAPLAEAPAGWPALDFDDAAWAEIALPAGYDGAAEAGAVERGEVIADSEADWSAAGEQGAAGWTYGYADRTAAADAPYQGADFVPFPRDGGGHSPTDFWNGTSYDWFAGNPPWTLIGRRDVHPNGINNGAEHWAIRRYTAAEGGLFIAEWTLRKANPNGTGVSGHLLHTGADGTALLDTAAVAGDDGAGVIREVIVAMAPGDILDLAVDPTGPDGDRRDGSDGSEFTLRVWRAATLAPRIATPLDAAGLAVRMPFEAPADADRVELSSWFDDGIAVWLDGRPLLADNAPALPVSGVFQNPAAPLDRPTVAALAPRVDPLDLAPGPHLIALAGLDAAAEDHRFLLGASVDAVRLRVDDGARYLAPTPGADNSPPLDLGPLVTDLTRDPPAVAGEALPIAVDVRPTSAPLDTVTLTWRVRFAPPQTVAMQPDPDGSPRHTATLPIEDLPPGELVRWFVEARDVDGRTTREPPFPDPLDSAQYFGTIVPDPSIDSALPVLHWFIEQPALADRPTGTRSVLWFDGELYDNVRVDVHGQSTRGFPKKSYDVDLNRDHRFRLRDDLARLKDFNLLSTYADKSRVRNTLAYEVFALTGGAHHLAFPMRIQRNGAFFAVADFVEDGDDRWIERLGYDPVGALYKVYDGVFDPGRGEKKTRKDEDNGDYAALIAGLSLPAGERRAFLRDAMDLARMADYLAASFIHGGIDCCHKNFYLYRDSDGTGRWWMLPWDVDLTFGRVWTGSYFDDRLYPQNGLFLGRDIGGQNQLLRALYEDDAFVQMYLRRTRTLVDTLLQAPDTPPEALFFDRRIDELTALIGEDALIDADAWPTWGEPQTMLEAARRIKDDFLAPRRAWVFGALAQHEPGVVLLPGDPGAALARYRVPLADDPALAWTAPDFDDADWLEGPLGLGYENAPEQYDALIATPVRPTDFDPAATGIQLRIPFVVDDPEAIETLTLSVKYDDGYVAWLNGIEIARRNVDGLPAWDAIAALHDDNQAVRFEPVDVTDAIGALRPGLNVLAMQVVNNGPGSSDLLIQPALVDGVLGEGILPPAQSPDAIALPAALEAADDPAESWVALVNPGPEAIDISGWTLRGGGIEHHFVPGTVIPAEGELFVVADLRRFLGRAASPTGGEGHLSQGDWRGRLDPRLGLPALYDATGRQVEAP